MELDRLAELQAMAVAPAEQQKEKQSKTSIFKRKKDIPSSSSSPDTLSKILKPYDSVKKCIDLIDSNSGSIDRLRILNKSAVTDKARNEALKNVDEISTSTKCQAALIADLLRKIRAENEPFSSKDPDSTESHLRANLFDQHFHRFQTSLSSFQSSLSAFQNDLVLRSRRELHHVNPSLSNEEVEKIVNEGKTQQVLMKVLTGEYTKQMVQDMEERHLEILKLEKQIVELYELWKDLSVLVDIQGESINRIEDHIGNAHTYVTHGEQQLEKAEDYQNKARKKRGYLLLVLLGIVAAITTPVAVCCKLP